MNILRFLFGCSHRNLSVPYTMPTRNGKSKQTYKVCLDCTAHVPYSLKTFTTKPARRRKASKPHAVAYGKFVAEREANRELEIAQQ